MKKDSLSGPGAVKTIADDGMPDGRHVSANLMRASGADSDFEQRRVFESLEDLEIGERVAASIKFRRHPRAMHGIARNGFRDAPGILFHDALHDADIHFFGCAIGELFGESSMRGVVSCDEKDPARSFVEPVDDARAKVAADFRKRLKMMNQSVYERAFVRPGSGVNGEAGGFVDRDDGRVLVENFDRQVFGGSFERRRIGGRDLDLFVSAENR